MIQSMTGFGKKTTKFSNKKISVEIKSLNSSKQMDLSFRIPNIYRDKEIEIRNMLCSAIERGKVELSICMDNSGCPISSHVNLAAFESYFYQICNLVEQFNIAPPVNWFSIILSLPEVIKTELLETSDVEWVVVKNTIDEALKAFTAFRMQEGVMLEKVLRNKINVIASLLDKIEQYDAERIEKIRERLSESINKMDIAYDENRFEQEMIYYIERLDVSEEKVRLDNHLRYFMETMENECCQGRKLGFIAQEIGREVNTLGAKSNHAEMQRIVVQMKDELEQIKEQVLNVL